MIGAGWSLARGQIPRDGPLHRRDARRGPAVAGGFGGQLPVQSGGVVSPVRQPHLQLVVNPEPVPRGGGVSVPTCGHPSPHRAIDDPQRLRNHVDMCSRQRLLVGSCTKRSTAARRSACVLASTNISAFQNSWRTPVSGTPTVNVADLTTCLPVGRPDWSRSSRPS